MSEQKLLPVPDALAGERADAGLARLMGLSRSVAADLLTDGHVLQNGKTIGKSDRLIDGAILEVTFPEVKNNLEIVASEVEGFKIVYQDEDIIVVDTPDALLVTTKEHAQRVKSLVDALKATGHSDVL